MSVGAIGTYQPALLLVAKKKHEEFCYQDNNNNTLNSSTDNYKNWWLANHSQCLRSIPFDVIENLTSNQIENYLQIIQQSSGIELPVSTFLSSCKDLIELDLTAIHSPIDLNHFCGEAYPQVKILKIRFLQNDNFINILKTFPNLEKLEFSSVLCNNNQLTEIASSLLKLKHFKIAHCPLISEFEVKNHPSLTAIEIQSCAGIHNISVQNLPDMTSIVVRQCDSVSYFNLRDNSTLENVEVYQNSLIKKLTFKGMDSVKKIVLSELRGLFHLDLDCNLANLEKLILKGNPHLAYINYGFFPKLTKLTIGACPNCPCPDYKLTPNLIKLVLISRPPGIDPNINQLQNLQKAVLVRCSKLNIPNFSGMKKLAYVCLNDNPDLASVNLKFAKIKVLHLGYCNQIASLPFEQLETLEELNLACNPKLENLTLKNLPHLKTVNVNSCSLEKALFENLPVEKVNLSYNPKLSKVSFLKCSKIKEIVDSQCENLLYIDFQESGSPVIAGKAIWKKKDHRE